MPAKAAANPSPLVNPRRSAHASIRGYLYQACLSAQRWLELGGDEILICEGDEDIDRLVRGGDGTSGSAVSGVSEQAKDYQSKFGRDAVRDVLAGFAVTYHAVRERGEGRRFRLITTAAQPASGSSATADLIDRWEKAEARDEVIAGARELLRESATGGKPKGASAAAAADWLDGSPDRWPDFVAGVRWAFGQPDIAGLRQQIAYALDGRPDTAGLAASLSNLGNRLSAVGRREEALAAAEEATTIHRELAKARPDAFLPDLALTLNSLGHRLGENDRPTDACDAYEQAVRALSRHFLALPKGYASRMVYVVDDYVHTSASLGRDVDDALLQPILAALQRLEEKMRFGPLPQARDVRAIAPERPGENVVSRQAARVGPQDAAIGGEAVEEEVIGERAGGTPGPY